MATELTNKKKKSNTLIDNTAQALINSKAGTTTTQPTTNNNLVTSTASNLMASKNVQPTVAYTPSLVQKTAQQMVDLNGGSKVSTPYVDISQKAFGDLNQVGTYYRNPNKNTPAATPTAEPTAEPVAEPTAEPKAPTSNGGGNGGGGNGGGNSYYDPSADLLAAYNARQEAQRQNYEAALEQLRRAYDTTVGDIRNQSDEALRQAYIKLMMDKRGLGQSLEAQGLRGGATESALAGLFNNYANNRNAIAQAVAQNLASAGNKYGENIANLGMQYNTNTADAMANYQTQLANARQSLASALAKTTSNYKGTGQDASSVTDTTGGTNALANPNLLIDVASGSLLPLSNPNGNSTGAAWNDVSEQNRQYRIRNYTPAYIRNNNMSALDAANYVKNLDIADEIKLAILQDAGFSDAELNAIANYF